MEKVMNIRFKSALEAAKKGPHALAAEIKTKRTDANIREFSNAESHIGDPLIHRMIKEIPDVQLPPLLEILIEHRLDLESKDTLDRTPLSLAARYNKINAVNFLLTNNAQLNTCEEPPLCQAISDINENELIGLGVVKALVEHKADINIQNEFSKSPLMCATEESSLDIMRYLLSRGADLFLENKSADHNKTAIGVAYKKYISYSSLFGEDYQSTQRAKKCLDLILSSLAEYLYCEGLKEQNEELFLTNFIDNLAGNTNSIASSNRQDFKKYLSENIIPSILFRIAGAKKLEQIHSFCMGSRLSKAQIEAKSSPPYVFRLFQNDGRHNLTHTIFSYIPPYNKLMENILRIAKNKPEYKPFIDAVTEKAYAKAIRRAATCCTPTALELIILLLNARAELTPFNLDEQAGPEKYSALHHAARKGNKLVYDLLIDNHANNALPDKLGLTPAQHMKKNKTHLSPRAKTV
jgi:ankyrin repeat protein